MVNVVSGLYVTKPQRTAFEAGDQGRGPVESAEGDPAQASRSAGADGKGNSTTFVLIPPSRSAIGPRPLTAFVHGQAQRARNRKLETIPSCGPDQQESP